MQSVTWRIRKEADLDLFLSLTPAKKADDLADALSDLAALPEEGAARKPKPQPIELHEIELWHR